MTLWNDLTTEAGIQAILDQSQTRPQLIFKHSTTCGTSAHVFHDLRRSEAELAAAMDLHYLDLLAFRPVSNAVAAQLGVVHQSPQAIVVSKGKVVAAASHFSVRAGALVQAATR